MKSLQLISLVRLLSRDKVHARKLRSPPMVTVAEVAAEDLNDSILLKWNVNFLPNPIRAKGRFARWGRGHIFSVGLCLPKVTHLKTLNLHMPWHVTCRLQRTNKF